MTQVHRVAVFVVALLLGVAACGSPGTKQAATLQDSIQVSGDFGAKPTIRIKTPLKLSESSSWVGQVGKGDLVGAEATTILQLTLADGRTGKTAVSTVDKGQQPLEVKLGDEVFPSLAEALTGKAAESRVIVASTADDAYGNDGAPQIGIKGGDTVVMVADILATDPTSLLDGPTGDSDNAPASAPTVTERAGVPLGFDVTNAHKPKKLVVIPLREGSGPAVHSPDRIALDYVGQVWGASRPFGETFSKEPAIYSLGMGGGPIKAWHKALVGLKEGARVMLICPPDVAYGSDAQPGIPAGSTLVYIVDVLGVG